MINAYQTVNDLGGALQEQLSISLRVIRDRGAPGLSVLHAQGSPAQGAIVIENDTGAWRDGIAVAVSSTPTWLTSADGNSRVLITWAGGDDGVDETIRLVDTYNTVAAGPDQPVNDAPRYTAFVLRNDPEDQSEYGGYYEGDYYYGEYLENISIAVSSGLSVALESTPMQTIPDNETEPSGLSWASTQEVGELAPGETIGVWLRHETSYDATAHSLQTVEWDSGFGARGLRRYYDETLEGYELLIDGVQVASSPTLPIQHTVDLSGSSAVIETRYRTQYDLVSASNVLDLSVDDYDQPEPQPPTAPRYVELLQGPEGRIIVTAFWLPEPDEQPITAWHVYTTDTGSDPDPATDTPAIIAATLPGGMVDLRYETGTSADQTEWRVLVRTVRDGVESTNTDIYTAISAVDTPDSPLTFAALGTTWGTR